MTQEKFSTAPPQNVSPLLDFEGTLEKYERREVARDNQDGTKGKTSIYCDFYFVEVEVISSTEPYPYPTAQIGIAYAPPSNSYGNNRWDAWAKSVRNLMPDTPADERLDALVGQRQRWTQLGATLRVLNQDSQKWENQENQLTWQVAKVDGLAAPEDLTEFMIGVADGKTDQALYQALLSDPDISPRIINRADIVTAITDRVLIDTLLMTKKLERDADGVLHKVG